MKNRWLGVLIALLLPLAGSAPAVADDLQELRNLRDTTIKLLNLLVEQGVITRQKADELIKQAEQAAEHGGAAPGASTSSGSTATAGQTPPANPNPPAAAPAPGSSGSAGPAPPVVRVPYVPETVKQEIREEVKQDVLTQAKTERWGEPGALPDWIRHVTVYGDVRLRYQGERFPNDSVPNASPEVLSLPQFGAWPETNTTTPVNILRIRARLGVEATIGDTVTAGVRIASGGVGTGTNGASESQTLGNYTARESVGIDRAYLSYHPTNWVAITGGRLGNPFFAPTTLVWGSDLSLEGVEITFTPTFSDRFAPFGTAGLFPILDVEPTPESSSSSKWLYAYQAGFIVTLPQSSQLRFATALYDYSNLQGIPNPTYLSTIYSGTAAPFRQGGNSVFDIDALANTFYGTQNYLIGLASKFDELNSSASLDLGFAGRTHVMLNLDYVKNLGFSHNEILARTGLSLSAQTTGAQAQLAVGDPNFERKYSWRAFVGYRYVQADSVVDAFTDADLHLGGTDAKGYIIGGEFAFETDSTIRARWMPAKQITGLPLAINVLQIDATTAF